MKIHRKITMSDAINKLSELEFAEAFQSLRENILKDPITYFIKEKQLIDFIPTPAQTVALKCIFGQKLDSKIRYPIYQETLDEFGNFDLETQDMTEVELYELMTGFKYNSDLDQVKNKMNLIVGRRGGKSTIASIIALYSTIKVNWKPFLTKTPVATVLVLSHSVDFSEEILSILKDMVEASPILNRLRDPKKKNTSKIFHLKVPFLLPNNKIQYSRVRVKVGAASKRTTRGSAICTLLCDEIAFWNLAEDAADPDTEILRAVRPALAQFGKHGTIIKLSSPGIKQGVLYDEWLRREALKQDLIQFKAPSWVWNTIIPVDWFKEELRTDPDGFDTEIRANFVDSISNFILPEFVDMCILKGINFIAPTDEKGVTYSAAIDAAFKKDRFAFAVVAHNENRVTTHVIKYWEGTKKKPVQAFEVAEYIRNVCKEFGLSEVTGDQHSFQPLREIFQQYGINLVENTFTLTYKKKIYFGLKRLIHNRQMDLLDIPLLAKEIKELQVEQTSTGQIRIGHPIGGSDDLSDSLAVASYKALEKAGVVQIVMGHIATGTNSNIKTDIHGRAFTAPGVENLAGYIGFKDVIDNSENYIQDPETKKWVRKTDLDEDTTNSNDTGNFLF